MKYSDFEKSYFRLIDSKEMSKAEVARQTGTNPDVVGRWYRRWKTDLSKARSDMHLFAPDVQEEIKRGIALDVIKKLDPIRETVAEEITESLVSNEITLTIVKIQKAIRERIASGDLTDDQLRQFMNFTLEITKAGMLADKVS